MILNGERYSKRVVSTGIPQESRCRPTGTTRGISGRDDAPVPGRRRARPRHARSMPARCAPRARCRRRRVRAPVSSTSRRRYSSIRSIWRCRSTSTRCDELLLVERRTAGAGLHRTGRLVAALPRAAAGDRPSARTRRPRSASGTRSGGTGGRMLTRRLVPVDRIAARRHSASSARAPASRSASSAETISITRSKLSKPGGRLGAEVDSAPRGARRRLGLAAASQTGVRAGARGRAGAAAQPHVRHELRSSKVHSARSSCASVAAGAGDRTTRAPAGSALRSSRQA